jgi:aminocarboxymuconate-semialdehyde decarboxylase
MRDAEGRRKWLAEHRVDKQVVGGWLDMFGYDIPTEEVRIGRASSMNIC